MLIKGQKNNNVNMRTVVNTENIYGFRITTDDGYWVLEAANPECDCKSDLGVYETEAEAEKALEALLKAYAKGWMVFSMPEEV